MKTSIVFFFLISTIASCGFKHVKENAFEQTEINGEIGMSQKVNFAQLQAKVLGPKCLSCHSDSGGNQGGLNLESYDETRAHLESIKQRVLVDQNMPPKAPLSSGEKTLLNFWILNELATNGQTSTPVKLAVLWPRVRDEIIQNHCILCHSPPVTGENGDRISTMEAGLDLTNLNIVREKADLIFKRAVIVGDMPLRPFPKLNDQEKKLLSQWMIDGMKDEELPPAKSPEEQLQ
jgi:uncharacterized membrane protein